MPTTPSITHYRLLSGLISSVLRSEIKDAHIEILEPMLTPGRHRIPNVEAFTVETSIAGSTLIATIHGANSSMARMWVVLDAEAAQADVVAIGHGEGDGAEHSRRVAAVLDYLARTLGRSDETGLRATTPSPFALPCTS